MCSVDHGGPGSYRLSALSSGGGVRGPLRRTQEARKAVIRERRGGFGSQLFWSRQSAHGGTKFRIGGLGLFVTLNVGAGGQLGETKLEEKALLGDSEFLLKSMRKNVATC